MQLTQLEVIEMDLCVLLGMTHHQMKSSITESEFLMWVEYMKLNPIHATDLQITKLTMLAAAFAGQKDIEFDDFYTHSEPERPKQCSLKLETEERTVGVELDMLVRTAYHS